MTHRQRHKQVVFAALLASFSLLAVEVGVRGGHRMLRGRPFPRSACGETIHLLAHAPGPTVLHDAAPGQINIIDRTTVHELIHPYLGYVQTPDPAADVSHLGFPVAADDPFRPAADNSYVVAVTGGSFAQGVATVGRAAFEQRLRENGIDARVLCLALAGYKQPQQLATLSWLLSLGADIDAVVNIDGFNEVALPPAENIPKGVNPYYPRHWYGRTHGIHDAATLRHAAAAHVVWEARRRWARAFDGWPTGSVALCLVWQARDRSFEAELSRTEHALLAMAADAQAGFLATGPDPQIPEGRLFEHLAAHWRNCSALMHAQCAARGIHYLHILQPNQYYEPGRVLEPAERGVAFMPDHPYRPGVVAGYPLLLANGQQLIAEGVDFHDLTGVFFGVPGAVYADACCHPSARGYEIVARYAADALARARR